MIEAGLIITSEVLYTKFPIPDSNALLETPEGPVKASNDMYAPMMSAIAE